MTAPRERHMTFTLLASLRRTCVGLVKVMGTLMWAFGRVDLANKSLMTDLWLFVAEK